MKQYCMIDVPWCNTKNYIAHYDVLLMTEKERRMISLQHKWLPQRNGFTDPGGAEIQNLLDKDLKEQ